MISENLFKIIMYVVLVCLLPTEALGQVDKKRAQDNKPFSASVLGGLAYPYTDQNDRSLGTVFSVAAHYSLSPFFSLNADVQKGILNGGDFKNPNSGNMGFTNDFLAITVTGAFMPFGFVPNPNNENGALNFLSHIYAGTGVGYLANNVSSNAIDDPNYGQIQGDVGSNMFIPIDLGMNVPVLWNKYIPILFIKIQYRFAFCLGDQIDGYIPTVRANQFNDVFTTLTVGLTYSF